MAQPIHAAQRLFILSFLNEFCEVLFQNNIER
jgi:hypothetical protein